MRINNYFDRVYINVPDFCDELSSGVQKLSLKKLIIAVAKTNPWGDGECQLYNEETHEVYEKRTKLFIVNKTRKYIFGMAERLCCCENMATHVSLRQLRFLAYAFEQSDKRISCYGAIYIYVIFTLLVSSSTEAKECWKYLQVLRSVVYSYLENNPSDELAEFLYGCLGPIERAIEEENNTLENKKLPAIPRNHPRENNGRTGLI